jgi:hypothetical protein
MLFFSYLGTILRCIKVKFMSVEIFNWKTR